MTQRQALWQLTQSASCSRRLRETVVQSTAKLTVGVINMTDTRKHKYFMVLAGSTAGFGDSGDHGRRVKPQGEFELPMQTRPRGALTDGQPSKLDHGRNDQLGFNTMLRDCLYWEQLSIQRRRRLSHQVQQRSVGKRQQSRLTLQSLGQTYACNNSRQEYPTSVRAWSRDSNERRPR